MHRYTPRWSDADTDPEVACPTPFDRAFLDAVDVIDYAADDRLTTWYTYPWLWHLDERGLPRCFSKGSSFCDVQEFAREPERVTDCRLAATDDECPPYWVIIESRRTERHRRPEVTEADAAAFLRLRRSLAASGIALLDDIVINERFEWWSLHELTAGTTAWDFTPPDAAVVSAIRHPRGRSGPRRRPHPR